MALVVETGSLVSGANAYVAVADCDAYHADRGNAAWTAATDAQKTAAIIGATAFIDGHYRPRLKGFRLQPLTQVLEWPRISVEVPGFVDAMSQSTNGNYGHFYLPTNQIPQRLKDAVCSLALRALAGALSPDLDGAVSKEKVDVIEVEYGKGFKGAVRYPEIDQLLTDYLKPLNSCDVVRG